MHPYTQDIEPTATPQGEFTDGDPILGITRTVLRSAWPNMLQRELLAVLADPHANDTQDGPLTPSKADFAQLVQAINNIAIAAAITRRPVGTIESGPYAVIPEDALALDHSVVGTNGLGAGLYNRDDYPILWAWIAAHYAPIDDANATAQPGNFTTGDGSTTFRVPDLSGLFVRGVGGNAAPMGVLQQDALLDHRHAARRSSDESDQNPSWNTGWPNQGSFKTASDGGAGGQNSYATSGAFSTETWPTGAAPTPTRTASENRPLNIGWRWIIWAK